MLLSQASTSHKFSTMKIVTNPHRTQLIYNEWSICGLQAIGHLLCKMYRRTSRDIYQIQNFALDLKAMKDKVLYDLSRDKKWKNRAQKKADSTKIKIGHGGTLDPMASGVLVVGVGLGTKKLQYYLSECQKTYETKALLGISTTTGDAEGEIITKTNVDHITPELVKQTVKKFVGDIKQTPPIFSALKVNGKPLYEYARQGLPLPKEIKVREVRINDIKVIDDDLLSTDHEFTKLKSELMKMVYQRNMD